MGAQACRHKKWACDVAGWIYGLGAVRPPSPRSLQSVRDRSPATLLGFEGTPAITTAIAVALVVLSTLVNLAGTKILARVAMFGFICEIIGAIIVGGYLLLFHRHQPVSIVFDTFNIGAPGSYWPAFHGGGQWWGSSPVMASKPAATLRRKHPILASPFRAPCA